MSLPAPFRTSAAAIGIFVLLAWGHASALTLQQGGYTATPFHTSDEPGSALAIGADGTLYKVLSGGIHKITVDGMESPWSTAPVRDLTVSPSGVAYGYGTTGTPPNFLVRIDPNGAYTTFSHDSVSWFAVTLGPDGALYAQGDRTDHTGRGFYRIDPSTWECTLLTVGSSGQTCFDLEFGDDGHLYTVVTVWSGAGIESHLGRLDGTQFTLVGALPHHGTSLARGANGMLWVSTAFDHGSGYPIGELWSIDTMTGMAGLFASVSGADVPFWGVAQDPDSRLYIGDPYIRQVQPYWIIQAVTGGALPARDVSWGALKARYREGAPSGNR
jgi:hypothetical protein